MKEPKFYGPPNYIGPTRLVECGLCNGWGHHYYGECLACNGTGYQVHAKNRDERYYEEQPDGTITPVDPADRGL